MAETIKIDMHQIPAYVRTCLARLIDGGYEAHLVGGAVRDVLLGARPWDFDVATNAWPEEVATLFSGFSLLPTGLAHGTQTLLIEGHHIEITTYRIDGTYSDSRRPDTVFFSRNLREDVLRRDFTINALAIDADGVVVDYVGGYDDVKKKLIRAVGQPELRFKEDALRILRALRFASTLGFSIEEETSAHLFLDQKLLDKVSPERISQEFSRLLLGDEVGAILRQYWAVIAEFIPEILPMVGFEQHSPYHSYDVWEHTVRVVSAVPKRLSLRLAALFHDLGKPLAYTRDDEGVGHFFGHQRISLRLTQAVLPRLKLKKQLVEQVEKLVLWHDIPLLPTRKIVLRRLKDFGVDFLGDLVLLKRADTLAQSEKAQPRLKELEEFSTLLEQILKEEPCFQIKDLAIDGRDLLSLGIAPGPQIGQLLQQLLMAVVEEEVENQPEALVAWVKEKGEFVL